MIVCDPVKVSRRLEPTTTGVVKRCVRSGMYPGDTPVFTRVWSKRTDLVPRLPGYLLEYGQNKQVRYPGHPGIYSSMAKTNRCGTPASIFIYVPFEIFKAVHGSGQSSRVGSDGVTKTRPVPTRLDS